MGTNNTKSHMARKNIALFIGCFAAIASCYAGETWLSIGKAASSEGGGTSLAVGYRGATNLALQLGVVFNSEFGDKEVLDYPVPHSSYRSLGTKRTGNTLGMDALYFINTDSFIRPYLGLGMYYGERKEIAQSTATGWYYTQGDKSKVSITGEAGLQAVTSGGFVFGAGYHSLRGPNISVGKTF
jgi:hypothetical protein